MSEHELEKLLGGFAADTLTQVERQKLFTAALQDQQLFNALADEQALKELLADPVVRRKLLRTLEDKTGAGTGGSLSWLDWFRRPVGLAFAGGLAAAVFAIVLGTKIYQDSLKQAARSVETEEVKPVAPSAPAPSTPPPVQPLNENIELKTKRDALPSQAAKKERASTPPSTQEQQTATAARNQGTQQSKPDEASEQAEVPAALLGTAGKQVTKSGDQKPLVQSPSPPAASSELAQTQTPVGVASSGGSAATTSARALFYMGKWERLDPQASAAEREQHLKALSGSAPQAYRPERRLNQFAAAGEATQVIPLGLRYSYVMRGTDARDREVDAAAASKSTEPIYLTVESNQDAYLQIWKTVGSSMPELLLPQKDTGSISVKVAGGQRQIIPLPEENVPFTLTARLSRVPFGPITRQEASMLDRLSPNQIRESVAPGSPVGSQEHAIYVVNTEPSATAQVAVDILPVSK